MEVAKRSYAHSMTIHCAFFDGKLKPPRWWQLLPICSVLQCLTLEEFVLCVRTLCFCVLGLKGEHHRLWLELGRYLLQVLQVVSDIWIIREAYSTVQCHLHGLLKVYFNFFPKKRVFFEFTMKLAAFGGKLAASECYQKLRNFIIVSAKKTASKNINI